MAGGGILSGPRSDPPGALPLPATPPDATSHQAWSLQSGADYRNSTPASDAPTIFVVDGDVAIRDMMRNLLEDHGYAVECFPGGSAFLDAHRVGRRCCLVIDALMPMVNGLEVLRRLKLNGLAKYRL